MPRPRCEIKEKNQFPDAEFYAKIFWKKKTNKIIEKKSNIEARQTLRIHGAVINSHFIFFRF